MALFSISNTKKAKKGMESLIFKRMSCCMVLFFIKLAILIFIAVLVVVVIVGGSFDLLGI